MERLEYQERDDTPLVILDAEKNEFLIAGKSLPEDTGAFFKPILNWLNQYATNPGEKTVFNFKLIYFNTATSKSIVDLLLVLENIHKNGNEVLVKWHYPDDDEDIQDSGEEFASIIEIPFEQVPYEYE